MKHIIITGGTRGIGFGMVKDFLKSGVNVTFCGTSDDSVLKANDSLAKDWTAKQFRGVVCDVSKLDDLYYLWDFATKIFGDVDIWINNAGITNNRENFNHLEPEVFNNIVDINIKGLMQATHLAFNNMQKQGKGYIYNMGGLGSDGRSIKGLTPYGMSKRAVQYFTRAFSREVGSKGNVKVGLLLPGMVLTDMLLDPIRDKTDDYVQLKRVYNLLADNVEPVSQYLVEKILSNEKNGAVISYSGSLKMFMRIPGRLITGRDIVTEKLKSIR